MAVSTNDGATPDGLEHLALANAVVAFVETLPEGSVLAIQGPWGRGKTDVLGRVHAAFVNRHKAVGSPEPLWLNPWQYGTPNLIAPLVIALLARLDPAARTSRMRAAARTLLRAGNAIAFKALSVVVPFGEVLQGAQQPVDELLEEFFGGAAQGDQPDIDPVAAMAARFRELVDDYLATSQTRDPLVICVDDLDRCLPDHQIAMLEAVHFLTAADARACFVVAIDPTLVKQAAISHYAGSGFDTNQYLDKLFDMRVTLRTLRHGGLSKLIEIGLAREIVVAEERLRAGEALARRIGITEPELAAVCDRVFYLPELTNPRLIARIFDRLAMFVRSGVSMPDSYVQASPSKTEVAEALVRLCAMTERWPAIRSFLQATEPDMWHGNLEFAAWVRSGRRPDGWTDKDIENARGTNLWLVDRLPDPKAHPDLGLFLDDLLRIPDVGPVLAGLNDALDSVGL